MKKYIFIVLIVAIIILFICAINIYSNSDKNNSNNKPEIIYSNESNIISDTNMVANKEIITEDTTDSYGNVTHVVNSSDITNDTDSLQNEDAYFDENGVVIEVIEDSISNSGCTIRITNSGGDPGRWGSNYIIEKYDNNEWIEVSPISQTIFDETISYSDKEYYDVPINWSRFYGELNDGTYRIGKYSTNGKCYYSESFDIK